MRDEIESVTPMSDHAPARELAKEAVARWNKEKLLNKTPRLLPVEEIQARKWKQLENLVGKI